MSELAIIRTPDIVAAEINAIKDQTRKIVLCNSIEIGKRLCEAKEMIPHGDWGNWLEGSVDYSQSTANNLMKIFDEYGASQGELFGASAKSQTLGNLSYSQAVALLGIPSEEREAFAKENEAESLSVRELQKKIEEYKTEKETINNRLTQSIQQKQQLQEELEHTEEQRKLDNQKLTRQLSEAQDMRLTAQQQQEELRKELQTQKAEAQLLKEQINTESNDDQTEELKEKLKEAEEKIASMQAELNKPAEIQTTVVEKVPEAIEKELEELRAKTAKAELEMGEEAITKYKIHFEDLTKCFSTLINDLSGIQNTEKAAKFKEATIKLLDRMKESLQ